MNIIKGVWIGALLYLANVLLSVLLVSVTNISDINSPILLWGGLIGLFIFTGLFSLWYFASKEKKGLKDGLYLGIIFAIISLIFDLIAFFVSNYSNPGVFSSFLSAYSTWQYWLGVVLILLASTLVGKFKS